MIQRLKIKNLNDIFYLINDIKDQYQDFYITKDRERLLIKDLNLIKKLLKHQEVYGLFDGDLKAIIMIYMEKPFRPYLKILSKSNKYTYSLLKFLFWNFNKEIFIKIKKENPLAKIISRFKITINNEKKSGFKFAGNRGIEILFRKINKGGSNRG